VLPRSPSALRHLIVALYGWTGVPPTTICSLFAQLALVLGLNLRLVGSAYSDRGRLEVLYNGIWGLVCRTGFDLKDAAVACHQLGFG